MAGARRGDGTNGLRINMPDRELHVPVRAYHLCDVCTLNQTFDVVLLAMKAYDARWASELIKPYLAPDGLLVGLQNAMTAELIAEVVGPSRTLGCVVEPRRSCSRPVSCGATRRRRRPGSGSAASIRPWTPRLPEIEELLRNVGKVSITPNVLSAKWMKLVVNTMCLGPFAIVGLSMADAVKLPGMRELFLRIGQEALDVGQDLGYGIEPIFGLKPDDLRGSIALWKRCSTSWRATSAAAARATASCRTSTRGATARST